MDRKHFAAETVAEAYLALLRDRGVDRLFVNGGTDFASVIEAYARAKDAGLEFPDTFVCPHENIAVSMAHGAYLVDARPQAVMLHTSVGSANGLCGLMNAARARVPILLSAGRTPLFEHSRFGARNAGIHWAQEMFDQAGMMREFLKWDYELRDGLQVEPVVDRAIDVAMSHPRGPVYLSLPREVLAESMNGFDSADGPPAIPADPFPDPAVVDEVAELVANAAFPVVIVDSTGIDHRTLPLLADLADRFDVAVLESRPRFVNLAADHPLHLGFQPDVAFREADVIIYVDIDAPWMQSSIHPRDDTVIVQCGADPLFQRYPMRSHRSDLTLTGTPRAIFSSLAAALEPRAGTVAATRRDRIVEVATASRARRHEAFEAAGRSDGPITKAFMNWAFAQVKPDDTIVVNESWAQPELLGFSEAGSFFGTSPAGGLGWGLPCAMGVQLAAPERTVVAALGDGAYLFANPAACHLAMAMHDLPVLTVLATNSRWGSVDGSARGMYPEGRAAASGEVAPMARLEPTPRYEGYVVPTDGYGEAVTERRELVPALERALKAVRSERRHALVNVICE